MTKLANPFLAFKGLEEKTAKIKAFNGATIKYRKLTQGEGDAFNKRLVKEYDSDGKPKINMDEINEIVYEKIALCLIEPAMTVDELKELSNDVGPAMTEISKLIDKKVDEVDDEGNPKD